VRERVAGGGDEGFYRSSVNSRSFESVQLCGCRELC
jgi:hypothetical protein